MAPRGDQVGKQSGVGARTGVPLRQRSTARARRATAHRPNAHARGHSTAAREASLACGALVKLRRGEAMGTRVCRSPPEGKEQARGATDAV